MDRILNSAFDFFAYALPGFCILASLFLLDKSLEYGEDFLVYAGRLHVGSGVVLLALSYILGFAIAPIGRKFFRWYQDTLFIEWLAKILDGKTKKHEENEIYKDSGPGEKKEPIFISDKFVLVRELAPQNFKYIESWHVYSLMSQNMVIAGVIASALTIVKIIWYGPSNLQFWIATVFVVMFLTFMFMYNAVKFSIWSIDDHNAAITKLHLLEQADKLTGRDKDTPKQAH